MGPLLWHPAQAVQDKSWFASVHVSMVEVPLFGRFGPQTSSQFEEGVGWFEEVVGVGVDWPATANAETINASA